MTPKQKAYRANLCRQYVGDSQGFLVAELSAMLNGQLPMDISNDHIKAQIAEHSAFISNFEQSTKEGF